LYVQNDCKTEFDLLAIELSKFFGSKGLIELFSLLFRMLKDKSIDSYFKNRRIPELPKDQRQWFESLSTTMDDIQEAQGIPEENGQAASVTDAEPEVINITKISYTSEKDATADTKHYQPHQITYNGDEGVTEQLPSNIIDKPIIKQEMSATDGGITNPYRQTKHFPSINEPRLDVSGYNTEVNYREGVELQYEEFTPITRLKNARLGISPNATDKSDSEDNDDQSDCQSHKADKKEIGRTGERYVFEKLKIEYKTKYPTSTITDLDDGFKISGEAGVEVYWLNKNHERGIGHDIFLRENGTERYIEVKSTIENSFDWFTLTSNEWESARLKGDDYYIYHVRNLAVQPICIRIKNPIKHWMEGHFQVRALEMRIPNDKPKFSE
jgi:hypothetical protein